MQASQLSALGRLAASWSVKECTATLLSQSGSGMGMLSSSSPVINPSNTRSFTSIFRLGTTLAAKAQGFAAGASLEKIAQNCSGPASATSLRSLILRRCKATFAAEAATGGSQPVIAETVTGSARALMGAAALSLGLTTSARTQLAFWMGGTAVWVYSMVVLGGVTRLTRSGLSMTDWKFTGEVRPVTLEQWEAEFAKYKSSPEFRKLHSSMTLDDFKFIFYMEYAHRMWGRFLGIAFAVPATYFAARRWIGGALAKRLGLLFFMGGTQGLVGWWMVRSGLTESTDEHATPRVSPYRLAAHLVSAFTIYATLVWTTLDLMQPKPLTTACSDIVAKASKLASGRLLPLGVFVAITATSGAFVAGMDAGRAFNTFPLMAGRWIPEDYFSDTLPVIRNFFEHTAAVQWDHRVLATTTLVSVGSAWLWMRTLPVPPRAMMAMNIVAAVTATQFALGVYTLLTYVPVHLGAMHQANALNLFTAMLILLHSLRPAVPSRFSQLVSRVGVPLAVLTVGSIGAAVTTIH